MAYHTSLLYTIGSIYDMESPFVSAGSTRRQRRASELNPIASSLLLHQKDAAARWLDAAEGICWGTGSACGVSVVKGPLAPFAQAPPKQLRAAHSVCSLASCALMLKPDSGE